MSENPKNCHQSLAQSLSDHGIEIIFGLMGDANLFLVDHYVRVLKGRFISAAHEGSAVLMALAHAYVSGDVAIATITQGPALTNTMTALTEGAKGQIPMVLMAGDTPTSYPQHLQSTDQREVVKASGAGFEQIRAPETASRDLARAILRARSERRPIVLNMPADFMWVEVAHERVVFNHFEAPNYVPEGDALDEAIGMIASAKRPMILAGAGAVDAREALINLSERLEAPLATTLKGKGLFNGHPNNIDIFGTLSTPAGYDLMGKADCLICFGAALQDFTTDRGKLTKGKRIVQIDRDARAIGRNLPPEAALIADAKLTAENILWWLNEAEIPASGFTAELDGTDLTSHPVPAHTPKEGYVNFVEALDRLDKALPENRVLITDGGRFMTEVWARIAVPDPRSFVFTANFGSIGLGVQEAIGAAVAAPDRAAVLFTGDGGFMMGGINEFNSAVRAGLDLIVIVANDSAYGAEHIQFLDRKMDPSLSEFDWPSFAAIATTLGGEGIEVRSLDELDAAMARIETRTKPLLIELCLHPDDVPRMRM